MKYMQNGCFQSHALMRLTLHLTLLLLAAFWLSNFALYFAHMNFTPQSVVSYYRGSEEQYRMPRTYQSMLEVTHMHLPMMALVILLLTHLLIFSSFSARAKAAFIVCAFSAAMGSEGGGWLVRFVHPAFAWLRIIGFASLQATIAFLLGALAHLLWQAARLSKLEEAVTSSSLGGEAVGEEKASRECLCVTRTPAQPLLLAAGGAVGHSAAWIAGVRAEWTCARVAHSVAGSSPGEDLALTMCRVRRRRAHRSHGACRA